VPKPWQRGHFAPAAFQSEDGVIPALSHIRQVLVERPHSPHKQDTVFSPSHHRTIAPSHHRTIAPCVFLAASGVRIHPVAVNSMLRTNMMP